MTRATVAYTDLADSGQAGEVLGAHVRDEFAGQSPSALILFASSQYDYPTLLTAIEDACHPEVLVGCSSAGEFTSHAFGEGSACAVALHSTDIQFSAGVGRGLSTGRIDEAAEQVVSSFRGLDDHTFQYRSALVLTDALVGHADAFVEQLTLATAGTYQFVGGGAGDDAAFQKTFVFHGTEALSDAVVALEILSNRPVGIGVAHGWNPASQPLRVTDAEGMQVVSLNAMAAIESFREHAANTSQRFPEDAPLPFFLHNVIGIDSSDGYKLRIPLSANADGSIACAAEIPRGATVSIMNATGSSAAEAAEQATTAAIEQLQGLTPAAALFFDCVATRLRLGDDFSYELRAVDRLLKPAVYAGCNTYGQIARAEGQFSGFHNCTAVVCVIPE